MLIIKKNRINGPIVQPKSILNIVLKSMNLKRATPPQVVQLNIAGGSSQLASSGESVEVMDTCDHF